MKICQEHWDGLKEAIEARGLGHLVAGSGAKAAPIVTDELEGSDAYDPLIAANFAIWNNALEAFGMSMMYEDAPCPLCLMDKHAAECNDPGCAKNSGMDWIGFAADGQLEVARNKGLVSPETSV